ncbi:MAG: ParB/RepB/Spo0J family partition protein, partial [Pseudomonadota bacterium]
MQLHHLNLTDLKPAKINVRKHGGETVEDLVTSIRSIGLIQPLLVRPNCQGYEVVSGQRRYHVLMHLSDECIAEPVPCIVMDAEDDATAIEASLAENLARLPMDEIDQFNAFAALVKQGLDATEIANKFGVTERLVTQRLAIANLIGPILTLYRKREIGAETIRILTMATKTQQRKWVQLVKSETEQGPEGYRLKCWLFGGQQIATEAALFDIEESGLAVIGDLFGEERSFADCEGFWPLQNHAIADAKTAYLAEGWADVIVLDIGEYVPSYDYVETAMEDGGKVYIHIAHNGEVTFYEGRLSRKEIKARERAKAAGAGTETAGRPELTKAMQRYLDLHRHAAVRHDLLAEPG